MSQATLVSLVNAYYTLDGIAFDEQAIRRGLSELVASPSLGGAWLIQHDASTVGYFVLTFGFDLELGGRQATITELYIEESARRRGLGTATLRFVEDMLRDLGIGAFELQAERDNVEALAFYAKLGMVAHDRVPLSKRIGPRRLCPRSNGSGRHVSRRSRRGS